MRQILAAAVLAALAGCSSAATGSTAPPRPATSAAAAAPSAAAAGPSAGAPGAAFCARLKTSSAPQTVYAAEVEHQVGLAGGGTVTPQVIQAARTVVALWIAISCPEYAYLEQHG